MSPNTLNIDLNSLPTTQVRAVQLPGGRAVKFVTSGSTAMTITFDSSPFSDGSLSVTATNSTTGDEKTTASGVGNHHFTGDRTGDIDITALF